MKRGICNRKQQVTSTRVLAAASAAMTFRAHRVYRLGAVECCYCRAGKNNRKTSHCACAKFVRPTINNVYRRIPLRRVPDPSISTIEACISSAVAPSSGPATHRLATPRRPSARPFRLSTFGDEYRPLCGRHHGAPAHFRCSVIAANQCSFFRRKFYPRRNSAN